MSDVQINIVGRAGHIQLARPKALNAMTIDMVTNMADALRSWVDDDNVHHVIITSSESRAFCAGGDVAKVRESGLSDDKSLTYNFFHDDVATEEEIRVSVDRNG